MDSFEHDRLDVYRAAIQFVALARHIIEELREWRSELAGQLQHAAASISMNIARGAGELTPADKACFYGTARRSATECAAILDIAEAARFVRAAHVKEARSVLLRVAAMLTDAGLKPADSGSKPHDAP